MSSQQHCRCDFPPIVRPGLCQDCKLSVYEVEQLAIRANNIPFRHWANGSITWQKQEELAEQVRDVIWQAFEKVKTQVLGQRTVLVYFQELALRKVKEVMLESNLVLEEIDENIFRQFDPRDFAPHTRYL